MTKHALMLAAGSEHLARTLRSGLGQAVAAPTSHFGWILGFTIGGVLVLVVVALVVPILVLAHSIGKEAPLINEQLTKAVHNTAPLAALRTTIEHATIIIGGLQRGRARLGG